MAIVVEWVGGCNGKAVTLDLEDGLVDAVQFGVGIESPPLNDLDPFTGYAMAASAFPDSDHNFLLAAIPTDSTPGDSADVVLPPGPELVGHGWFIQVATVIETEALAYAFPAELFDTGYTLTVGLATIGEGGTLTTHGATYPLTTAAAAAVPELAALIGTGTTAAEGLFYATVTEGDRAAVAAGDTYPFVSIDGPDNGRDPLLLVAELALVIGDLETSAYVRSVVRQFPRDDDLGLGSARRIHPPPRSGRIAGGHQ